jgi:hypothetical protein
MGQTSISNIYGIKNNQKSSQSLVKWVGFTIFAMDFPKRVALCNIEDEKGA